MVEARSVLLLTIAAALALIGLLLMAASQSPVQQWPGHQCREVPAAVGPRSDCVPTD
jgi:hypothetical protein